MNNKKPKNLSNRTYLFLIVFLAALVMLLGELDCQSKSDNSRKKDYASISYDFQTALSEIDNIKDGLSERAALHPVKTVSEYDQKVQDELKKLEKYLREDSLRVFFVRHNDLVTRFDSFRGTEINDNNRSEIEFLLNEFLKFNSRVYNYLEIEYLNNMRKINPSLEAK